MKIAIDCGHTIAVGSADGGAEGCGKLEQNLTREVGGLVMAKLQNLGHEVINCTCDDCSDLMESLSYRTNTANNNGAEIFVSIHFNAFNGEGHGTEVFTYKGKEIVQARNILNNIVALGYTNRGIKGEGLYVTNHTNMTAMLVECCFIDNENDMSKYNANNFADAIVKGLVGQTVDVGVVQDNQPITQEVKSPIQKAKEFVGSRCLELQQKLNKAFGDIYGRISEDNDFGQLTYTKLGEAQKMLGITCDYLAGDKTFSALDNYIASKNVVAPTPQSSTWVADLQNECNNQGYSNQVVDNIAGRITLASLPTLSIGSQGNITKLLQERLNSLGFDCGYADGSFGNLTLNAVISMQNYYGIGADGICGKLSWSKLLGLS